jgi:SAM-dependent methyltransferase
MKTVIKNTIKKMVPVKVLKKIKLLLNTLQIVLHRGHTYQCPVCGYRSRDWYFIGLDFPVNKQLQLIGAGLRKAGCYKCHSTDKERLLYLYLQEFFKNSDVKKHHKILHFAPEKSIYNFLSNLSGMEYITADLFPQTYADFAKNIVKMDITHIPLESDTIDLIICNHVLEHVLDDIQAMKELYRVLKPGGNAILQVPISAILEITKEDTLITGEKERELAFGQSDHVRIYGQDYFQRLASVGFETSKIEFGEKKEYFGLNPKERIFLVKKHIRKE